MIGGGKTKAFIRLRHEIADIDFNGGRIEDRLGDASHQQVRDQAGE